MPEFFSEVEMIFLKLLRPERLVNGGFTSNVNTSWLAFGVLVVDVRVSCNAPE
jgi:hypothetical protein